MLSTLIWLTTVEFMKVRAFGPPRRCSTIPMSLNKQQTGLFAALSRRTTRGKGSDAAVAPPPEVVEDPGDELLILTVALSRLATRSAVFHSAILKKNGVSTIRKSLASGGASNKSRLAMLRTLALLCLKDDGRAEVYADKELLHLIEDIEVRRLTFPKPQTLNPKLPNLRKGSAH
jgi:hypothetical protein